MTTDTATAAALDEAENIVRAEWLRLLTAADTGNLTAVTTELPVARPRPPKLALCGITFGRRDAPLPAGRRHRSATRRRNRRVWPTQRSPPWPLPSWSSACRQGRWCSITIDSGR